MVKESSVKNVGYPSQYETRVLLKNGTNILFRPIKASDAERWLAFVNRLSPQTRYLRFHHTKEMTIDDAIRYCTVDYDNTFALVAEVLKEPHQEIVALGRYYRLPKKHVAQVNFAVEDVYQNKGIGTGLIQHLINVARNNGITSFEAEVLAENKRMIDVFRNYGFHISSEISEGIYRVSFSIKRNPNIEKKEAERERGATLASLDFLLNPHSVALIGASRHPDTIGNLLLKCMISSGYSGKIFPVNPNVDSLMSLKCYHSVLDIPENVDMAVIAIPAAYVAKVADECGHKGVRCLVVISDGFKEVGPEGASREKELRDVVFGHGMRVIGPNCMGVINTSNSVKMNATFSPIYPPAGNVAFLSQSGAMGLTILEYARNLNMGISTFISVGNRIDISSNDLLEYWEQDKATDVILLYLESFGNARKFANIARRVTSKKPIVVVKSGSTPAGSRAASSHTGAMATSDIASDVLFRHAGIIRVNIMEELFDVATLLSNQPLPTGKNIVILTNGGGPGIIAADAAARNGLTLPSFTDEMVSRLRSAVKRDININNPLDTTAGATAEEFEEILKILAGDNDINAVLTIFIPPIIANTSAMENTVRKVSALFRQHNKPLLACFLGERGFKTELGVNGKFVPSYPFPEEAIAALARAVEYAETRRKLRGKIPKFPGIKRDKAQRLIEKVLIDRAERPIWLETDEIGQLLDCYGINFVRTVLAYTAEKAAVEAARIGFPVAVKLASVTITHKSDVGGVMLDLNSEKEVKAAFNSIKANLHKLGRQDEMEGVVVQQMIKKGVEAIVGVTQDVTFGPLMMFGTGGIYAEQIKDVALRLHPITDLDAREMIGSIKMAKLLEGYRGSPPSDTKSIEDLLLRLSAMIDDITQISELDFNPVKVMPQGEGYWVVDARIMIR